MIEVIAVYVSPEHTGRHEAVSPPAAPPVANQAEHTMTDKRTTWKINESKRDKNWLIIIGPYDEGFVAAIKRRIPAQSRQWDKNLKAWKVHSNHRAGLEKIIAEFSWSEEA